MQIESIILYKCYSCAILLSRTARGSDQMEIVMCACATWTAEINYRLACRLTKSSQKLAAILTVHGVGGQGISDRE